MSSLESRLIESLLEIPQSLGSYIDLAINADYMIGIFISSSAAAKEQSIGLKAGLGKSTLGCDLAHHYIMKYDNLIPDDIIPHVKDFDGLRSAKAWEKLKQLMMYFAFELYDMYDFGEKYKFILPIILWDDITGTLGKSKSNSTALRDFASDLLTKRRRFRVLVATGSDINDLAAPLRNFFDFEIIVPRRGVYEVQKKARRKNFWSSVSNIEGLKYMGTNTFEKLPGHFEQWYDKWRLTNESKLKEITKEKVMSLYKFKDGELVGEVIDRSENEDPTLGIKFSEEEREVIRRLKRDGSMNDIMLRKENVRLYSAALRLKQKNIIERTGQGSHVYLLSNYGETQTADIESLPLPPLPLLRPVGRPHKNPV